MKNNDDPRELLKAASEYMAENGHIKRASFKYGVPVKDITDAQEMRAKGVPSCALGSIEGAWWRRGGCDSYMAMSEATNIMTDWVRGNTGFTNIPSWNDHPDTTAEDVILALKRAAEGD